MKLNADDLGRYGWRTLCLATGLSVVASLIYAAIPGQSSELALVAMVGFPAAILLGLPALVVGLLSMVTRKGSAEARKVVLFFGPLVVWIGMELVPHLVNPCLVADAIGRKLPELCETVEYRSGFGGRGQVAEDVDVRDRFHLLHHTLVGAIPMALLYRSALRRWHPTIIGTGGRVRLPNS